MIGALADKIVSIFSTLIEAIFDFIMEPFLGISSLQDLVFGKNDDGELVWNTFTETDLVSGLGVIYHSTLALAVLMYVMFLVLYGIRFAKSGMTPQARTELIQNGLTFLFIGLGLRYLPLVYDILFSLNGTIVNFFSSSYSEAILTLEDIEKDVGNAIGRILLELVLIGLAVWANFYYLMRKITLLILMGLGPIFFVMLLHPRLKVLVGNWFRELTSSIGVQSIHALTYWFLTVVSLSQTNIIGTLITFVVFIPVTVAVRNLFGLGGQMTDNLSKAGAALGLSSLMAMGGAVKGAMGNKSLGEIASGAMNTMRGNYEKGKNNPNADVVKPNGDVTDTIAGNAGSDKGSTKDAEKMLRNGEILSNIGKGTMGALGAIAGAGIGPMGSAAFAGIGYSVGGSIGGTTGRMATALGQQARDRINKANALLGSSGMSEEELKNADVNAVADAIAENEAATWASENKDTLTDNLRNRYPDASESEIQQLLAKETQAKKAQYKKRAGEQLKQAAAYGNDHLHADNLAENSAKQMTNAWADNNREKFNEDYASKFPQQPNESDKDFLKRQNEAFHAKTSDMERQFTKIAGVSLKDSINELGHVNKAGFAAKLSQGLNKLEDVNNPDALAMVGANSGKGISLFNSNGRLDKDNTINALASSATLQDKEKFLAAKIAKGVSPAEATKDWNDNYGEGTFANHKARLSNEALGASINNGIQMNTKAFEKANNGIVTVGQRLSAIGQSTMLDTFATLDNHKEALSSGANSFKNAMSQGALEGKGAINKVVGATIGGFNATKETYAQQGIEMHGSAIDAQAAFQNKVGYVGGVLLGSSGYVGAKKLGMKINPYKESADAEAYSATEVMQMAQTTTDPQGNTQITPGAIRQVVTADSSYLEVLTRSGDRKRVSRLAAGDSGLSSDSIVYQDLEVKGNTLVPSSIGGAAAYHLDNGGAKIPSDVRIMQNPNTLLKQGSIQKFNVPSQVSTSGISVATNETYSPSEVQQLALSTTGENGQQQIVRGAIRQVMTGSESYVEVQGHDGKKYRVSPKGNGNSNLSNGQVLYQDLEVQNGQYVPLVANIGDTKTSTYTTNSAGLKQTTKHRISQNPNDLFSNQVVQTQTISALKGKEYPAFNQFVDNGQFFTEDLTNQGFTNIKTIIENNRQFVTGEKGGISYRVSPVFAGDSRLTSNEVQEIQMNIESGGRLVPTQPLSDYSAQASVFTFDNNNNIFINNSGSYSSTKFKNLIISRKQLGALNSAQNRKLLEEARQQQGSILG